jgi:HK97 family phage portal protein
MQIGPFTIARTKALQLAPLSQSGNGWFPWGIIRESFTGAWQRNVELRLDDVMTNPTLFACQTLIAADVAKLCLRLVEQDEHGVWTPIESPAFSPVLRRPNHYQIVTKFVEQWIQSKLSQGNTYVLLQRDNRRIVRAMYVLDPSRVTPLVTPAGDVYYELKRDDLSGITQARLAVDGIAPDRVLVPASEIIHDRMVCIFHPLIGVTPIYACGQAASQGLTIQSNSNKFFSNGSTPGGVLTAPGAIAQETAERLKAYWEANYTGDNVGKIAVLGDGLKYEAMRQTAVDSQLIDQLKWSDERICSTHHVPPYMVGVGPPPPYANVEPLLQAYYAQCIQSLLVNFENCLDHGLGLDEKIEGKQYGTEFDIDDLIWMDTATRSAAAQTAITSGLSFNEVRKKYYGVGPVKGGESPLSQQQNYSIAALAERDANDPFAKPAPTLPPADNDDTADDDDEMAASVGDLLRKELELTAA